MIRKLAVALVLFCGAAAYAQSPETAAPAPSAAEQAQAPGAAPPPIAQTALPEPAPAQWWARSEWWLVMPIWLLALAALALAVYTARLWRTTATLMKEHAESARKELRAYVALDEIFFTESDEPATGEHKLRMRNYGQTPAYGMSIWCERASHLPQEGVKPFYDSPLVDGQLLHPVQAYTVALASAPLYRIGKPGFFTYGRIVYHDIYQQWWTTKFCFRYEGDGSFVPHGDYNDEEGPFEKRPT